MRAAGAAWWPYPLKQEPEPQAAWGEQGFEGSIARAGRWVRAYIAHIPCTQRTAAGEALLDETDLMARLDALAWRPGRGEEAGRRAVSAAILVGGTSAERRASRRRSA